MTQVPLAPPPPTKDPNQDRWLWLLWRRLNQAGQILWSSLDFTGSNLTDIATRNHVDLQNHNTTDYYHLTQANHTDLTDGGATTLHKHDHSLQDNLNSTNYTHLTAANHTDLTDGGATTLHKHDHSLQDNLNSTNYTHLTAANHTDLTDGGATTLHKHDHGGMDGLADDDHTQYLLVAGTRALTGNWEAGDYRINSREIVAGEQGSEGAGITVNGITHAAHLRVSDINNTHPAEFIVHRHSLTLPSTMITARSNSNGNSHGNVVSGDSIFSLVGVGWNTSSYWKAASIDIEVDGTPSATSMPGRFVVKTTPTGSVTPAEVFRISQSGAITVASTALATNLNADLLDSQHGAHYLDSANFTGTNWTDLTDGGNSTLHYHLSDRLGSDMFAFAAAQG